MESRITSCLVRERNRFSIGPVSKTGNFSLLTQTFYPILFSKFEDVCIFKMQPEKLLSEIDMLDQAACQNFELFNAASAWLVELVCSRKPKIPQSLVQLANRSSEEIRQHLKQKQELLGLNTEEGKKMDLPTSF